jgi:hypothetical protein
VKMNIHFNIGWNFGGYGRPNDFFCKTWQLSQNKFFETQITYFTNSFTLLRFKLTHYPKTDHTPYNLDFVILNLEFLFTIYDNRHWNYEEGRWCTENLNDKQNMDL